MALKGAGEAGLESASKEKAAARRRAQEALDAVQRAVEGDKLWGEAEWSMLTADAKEEKRRSEQKDGCNADAAARLRVTNPSASLAHHPCICACLTAVLGPHKLPRGEHQCATPDGHDLRSVSPQEASTDEETEDDEGRFEGIRVSREDQKLVEERYGSGTEEGHPRARREVAGAHRAAERARLERLCLELARLEARLQDVVTRGRAARPRTEGYDARPWSSSYESRPRNPSYKSRPRTASYESRPRTASDESEGSPQFEDKRTIFERAAPARRAPLPEDYKSRPRNARAHAPGAQNEPHWGKSEAAGLARGAYEAARLCRLGVKPCAYRRRNSAGGEGREALRCCDGCGSTSEEPTWATCADVGRGKGGEELVRLKRHHRALSAHCRRQVGALREVAARARVAEGLATRAARAAAAAAHPAAGTLCGPAAVCRNHEGCGPLWLC